MAKKDSQDKLTEKGKKKRGPGRPRAEVAMGKFTYYMPVEIAEKVAAYAYWERLTVSAVLTMAVNEFFKRKKVKPRPETKSIKEMVEEGER